MTVKTIEVTEQMIGQISGLRQRLPALPLGNHEARQLRDAMVALIDAVFGPVLGNPRPTNGASPGGAISRHLAAQNAPVIPQQAPPPMTVGPGAVGAAIAHDPETMNAEIEIIGGRRFRKMGQPATDGKNISYQYVPVDEQGNPLLPEPEQSKLVTQSIATQGQPVNLAEQPEGAPVKYTDEQIEILKNVLPPEELKRFGLHKAAAEETKPEER